MQGRIFLGPNKEKAPDHQFLFRNRMDERDDLVRAIRDKQYRYMRVFLPHRPDGQTLDYPFQTASWSEWYAAWKAGKCDKVRSAFWERRPCELLFDVEADPWEIHNLAGDPAHAETVGENARHLPRRNARQADIGLIPEAMFDELRGDKTIMEYVRSDAYPVRGGARRSPWSPARKNSGNVYKLEKAMKKRPPGDPLLGRRRLLGARELQGGPSDR